MKVRKIIGHFVDIDENDEINKEILTNHITHYMKGVGQVLVVAFALITVFQIIVTFLIRTGHFTALLYRVDGRRIQYKTYIMEEVVFGLILWAVFGLYYLLWRKADFTERKKLICILTLLSTTLFCFFYWKNNTLVFLYVLPIIMAIPLDKKLNKRVMISSIILIIIYSIFQYNRSITDITILIALSAILTIVVLQFICIKIHNTMNRSFLDIKGYAIKQKALYEKLFHDELTTAYSKTALRVELDNLKDFVSLAFIDIDKFKHINDTYGHQMGDEILKLLVFCIQTSLLHIYRNGGDEFVVLSTLDAKALYKQLEERKKRFSYYANEFFEVQASVSIGIINIDKNISGDDNIKKCDALMYKSKEKGRDTLTIEE